MIDHNKSVQNRFQSKTVRRVSGSGKLGKNDTVMFKGSLNYQKLESRFFIHVPAIQICSVALEAVGLSLSNYTFKIKIFLSV